MSTVTSPAPSGARFASRASAATVAGIAAIASYSHMRHLALDYGQDPLIAALMPISVDGMLITATTALVDGRRRKASAWLAFLTGVAASITANVLAAPDSAIARAISAWPAVALLLVVEVLARSGRSVPAVQDEAAEAGEAGQLESSFQLRRPGAELADIGQLPPPSTADDPSDLSTAARMVADEHRTTGRRLTRDGLAAALRERGHAISTARAGTLVRELA